MDEIRDQLFRLPESSKVVINDYIDAALKKYRAQNETDLTEINTAKVRGKIAELKTLQKFLNTDKHDFNNMRTP